MWHACMLWKIIFNTNSFVSFIIIIMGVFGAGFIWYLSTFGDVLSKLPDHIWMKMSNLKIWHKKSQMQEHPHKNAFHPLLKSQAITTSHITFFNTKEILNIQWIKWQNIQSCSHKSQILVIFKSINFVFITTQKKEEM